MIGNNYLCKWIVATHNNMTSMLPHNAKTKTFQHGNAFTAR